MIVGAKKSPISLIGKRLFKPVLLLTFVLLISTLGFMIIPGVDGSGNQIHLSFFDAFFITSYTATTIGFGEIPYPFTQDQKVWMLFVIYTSVFTWLFNMGSIIRIFQDDALWSEFNELIFSNYTKGLNSNFYVVLGFGRTGEWVTEILDKHKKKVIVIEPDSQKLQKLIFKKYSQSVRTLNAKYSSFKSLRLANIDSDYCKGVFIVGGDVDENKNALVVSRSFGAHTTIKANNQHDKNIYARIGSDNIVNLEQLIKTNLYDLFHKQSLFILESLLDEEFSDYDGDIYLPIEGNWLVWGLDSRLETFCSLLAGDNLVFDSSASLNPPLPSEIPKDVNGIIAAGNDIDNISFIDNARARNPGVDVVVINEHYSFHEIYDNMSIDYIIKPWLLFVENIFTFVGEPLINDLFVYLANQEKQKIDIIISKVADIYVENNNSATTWTYTVKNPVNRDSLISNFGRHEDHVIIFSSLTNIYIERELKRGEKILISSRYPVKIRWF